MTCVHVEHVTRCAHDIYTCYGRDPCTSCTRVRRGLCKSTAIRKMRLCSTKEKSFKRRVESIRPKDISRKCKKASEKHHKHLNLVVFTLYMQQTRSVVFSFTPADKLFLAIDTQLVRKLRKTFLLRSLMRAVALTY